MPRIRTVKPELWQSPQVMNLSHGARLLFIGLITQADDFGRGCADLRKVKASIFPGDACDDSLPGWLAELAAQRLAIFYRHIDHGDLFALPTWDEHQYVQKRAKRSRYPRPDGTTGTLPESDGSTTVGSEGIKDQGREGKEGSAHARDDSPPDANLQAEADRPPGLDPAAWDRWHDYRVKIRKPLKPVSIPAAQRELAAFGCNQAAVVEQSIAQGWTGVFELKRGMNGSRPPGRRLKTADEIEAEERIHAVG